MIKVNDTVLKQKLSKISAEYRKQALPMNLSIQAAGAVQAVKYTPPKVNGAWSTQKPSKKQYTRPIYETMYFLGKDNHLNKQERKIQRKITLPVLWQNFRSGNKFFAYHDAEERNGKRSFVLGFGPNKEKLRRQFGRIKYYGLMKVVWGLQLLQKGIQRGKFQNVIKALLSQSPALKSMIGRNVLAINRTAKDLTVNNQNLQAPDRLKNSFKSEVERTMKKAATYSLNKFKKENIIQGGKLK